MVSNAALTLGNLHLFRRERNTYLGISGSRELNRIRIHSRGRDDFSRSGIPLATLRAFHQRSERRVEVLHNILDTGRGDPLNRPPNGAVIVGPPEFQILRVGIFVVGSVVTVARAGTRTLGIAPHELLDHFAVQNDGSLFGANGTFLKTGSGPPRPLDIDLIGISRRDLIDLTGQIRLVSNTFADLSPVVQQERKRRIPLKGNAPIRGGGRDRERLADRQLFNGPGTADVDLGRDLSRCAGGLGDFGMDLRSVFRDSRRDHTSDNSGPKADRGDDSLHCSEFLSGVCESL